MLEKNIFISQIYYFLSMYNIFCFTFLSLWILIFYQFIITNHYRHKFFLFLINLLFFIMWGFYVNLDGIMLILLLTELLIFFVFLLIYLQLSLNTKISLNNLNFKYKLIFFTILLMYLNYNASEINFTNFYNSYYLFINWIISADFFFIYIFFFVNYPLIPILISIILGIFSIIFIFYYFYLKKLKNKTNKTNKTLYFLRKQNHIKQAIYKTPIRTFQKKN